MRKLDALVSVVAATAALTATAGTALASVARISADVRIQGVPVPRSFLGFSQEYNIIESNVGTTGVNTATVGLFRTLASYGGGPPGIRIGGGSQDSAWWNPTRQARPTGVLYDLSPAFFAPIDRFLAVTGSRAVVGLNLAINDPRGAVETAQGVAATLTSSRRVRAYEVGNEPAFFSSRLLTEEGGRKTYTRPPGYDADTYGRELDAYTAALHRYSPLLPLAADPYLITDGPPFLRRHGDRLAALAVHYYPLSGCKDTDRPIPGPAILLQEDVMAGIAKRMFGVAQAARAAGVEALITEVNSAACGGIAGVSDTFASTLWGADWMFSAAATGIDAVYFHNSSPLYAPFLSAPTADGFGAVVSPLFYGMLLFAEATPHRARLLPTTYLAPESSRTAGGSTNLKIWGTVDPKDRVVRVVVISKGSLKQSTTVEIRVPFARGRGRLKRLTAKGMRARDVRWGGQVVPSPTTDGRLTGRLRREFVVRRRGDRFRFRLPAFGAALLTVPVSRTKASRYLVP